MNQGPEYVEAGTNGCHFADGMFKFICFNDTCSLQWRHNGRLGVSNHQHLDCLLSCSGAHQRKHQISSSQMASNAENVSILVTSSCVLTTEVSPSSLDTTSQGPRRFVAIECSMCALRNRQPHWMGHGQHLDLKWMCMERKMGLYLRSSEIEILISENNFWYHFWYQRMILWYKNEFETLRDFLLYENWMKKWDFDGDLLLS